MFRWSKLIPRTIILGLILLAAWAGIDSLVKSLIIQRGQQITGAKIEIGQVRTSLSDGKVFLQDVRFADPRNPMLNLVQADVAYMLIDRHRLLHGEIVVESGTTHQVMLGATRTTSGEIGNRRTAEHSMSRFTASKSAVSSQHSSASIADAWINSLQPVQTVSGETNFETAQVAVELNRQWPLQFQSQIDRIGKIRSTIQSVRGVIEKTGDNPLRDEEKFVQATQNLAMLQTEIAALQEAVTEVERRALEDRGRLIAARERDQDAISAQYSGLDTTVNRFESGTLSGLLLESQQEKQIDELVTWFEWFRKTVPDPDEFQPVSGRGINIEFDGVRRRPEFLIRQLALDGEGNFAGRHFSFVGIARDLTPDPANHDLPVTIELRAQGQQHLIVKCSMDRRGDLPMDSLYVSSPHIETAPQRLGDEHALAVSMGSSKMQIEANVQITGNELSGRVLLYHSDVSLFVDNLHELAGGKDVAARLNQELAVVKSFQTEVQLGGTVEGPRFTFDSNLGDQFAATLNRAADVTLRKQAAASQAKLDAMFQAEIDSLDRNMRTQLDQISNSLDAERIRIAELQSTIRRDSSDFRIR